MRRYIIALFLLFGTQEFALSQTLSQPGDGTDFFLGYPQSSFQNNADSSLKIFSGAYLLVSSYTSTNIAISYFDKQTGAESIGKFYSIPARTGIQIPLNSSRMNMGKNGDSAEYAACHIVASRVINVMLYSSGPFSGGSYLAIQTPVLGKQYVAASYFDKQISQDTSRGFFLIVAPNDSTYVTVRSFVNTLGGHKAGLPYTFELRKGQCYLVKSAGGDSISDISGSVILSDKPIAVISGHENAVIGNDNANFMIQQMLPQNILDTTGYVSLPLTDSSGENYRIYSSLKTQVKAFGTCSDSTAILTNVKNEIQTATCPINFEAENGNRFSPIMYERDNPAMMNIIPISRWRNSFLWYVPRDSSSNSSKDFVNIIAQKKDVDSNVILASFNGGQIIPINNLMSLRRKFDEIPNHSELIGLQFEVVPGSYYVTAPHPLMVYSYGNHSITADSTNYVYSYSSPAGFALAPIQTKISINVDTLNATWNICVHDSTFGLAGYGIKYIDLMNCQDCIEPKTYIYFNTHIDIDSEYTNQIIFSPPDTEFCFKVSIPNPNDSAYAPIFIEDSSGETSIIELRYYPSKVSVNLPVKTELISFTILPNPATGNSLTISLPELNKNAQVIICDILGREILREKIPAGILQTKLSIANLENGIYYAKVASGNFSATQKFEIVR